MATSAHSATGTLASSGKIENHSATRRGVLGLAAGLGAVAVAAPIAAMPAASRPWDLALARYRAANAAAERFRKTDYDPAWVRINAAAGGSPQLSAKVGLPGYQMRTIMIDRQATYPDIPEYAQARSAQAELRDWWDRRCAAEGRHRVALEHQDALWETEDASRTALMAEPAPDAAALATKILIAFENEDIWEGERHALAADAERLRDG